MNHGTKHRTSWRATLVAAALASLVAAGCGASELADEESSGGDAAAVSADVRAALQKEGPVEILDPACCDGSIAAEVLRQVYSRVGGEAKRTQIADITQHFPVLAKQDDGFSPSIWDFSMPQQFEKYVDQEKTVKKVPSAVRAEEGWYVPTYVIKGDPERGIEPSCPELPDWKALNKCVELFATSETGGKGAFLTAGKEWAKYYGDDSRVKNLKLNYEIVFTGSEAALTAAIKRNYDRGEPFVALAWKPHYVTLKYDLTRVEFPPYSDACWGKTYACNWPDITIWTVMSANFPTKHPTAFEIMENSDLNDEDMNTMMSAVEEDGKSYEEVAEEWLDANVERWQSWIPKQPATAPEPAG